MFDNTFNDISYETKFFCFNMPKLHSNSFLRKTVVDCGALIKYNLVIQEIIFLKF